jgi:purine-binding chemotaxis protein CheW
MDHRYRHDPSKTLVGFAVGDVHYAVPIARVKEIANPISVVALPHAPPSIVGVADYRGEVVPVVDLRSRFGLASAEATRRTKWIIVAVGGRLVALVVDSVTEVFGTAGAELRPAPTLGGDDVRGIEGVTTHEGSLVFVLGTEHLRDVTEPLVGAGPAGSKAGIPGGSPAAGLPGGPRS